MRVLGLETSCDETGMAIYAGPDPAAGRPQGQLLGQVLHSQIALHDEYGGVVPELASRDHIRRLLPLLETLLADCGLTRHDLDAVAFTRGPGLMGALMSGAMFGRSLAFALGIPAIGVHHMEGHLLAPLLSADPPAFPFVALLVSGGHTQLMRVDGLGQYALLGESIDDAAGEAFDKVAKMLGLPYPGGPQIARLAQSGNAKAFAFPRPLRQQPLDFSFSGLKNAVRLQIARTPGQAADIAASFEAAVVDSLTEKCMNAIRTTGLTRLVIAGGVSANQQLRQQLTAALTARGGQLYVAEPALCTDNGAMIAFAGYQRLRAGQHDDLAVTTTPRWPMTSLSALPPDHAAAG